MKTKQEIIEIIRTNKALFRETIEAIIHYLSLPTLEPHRIDAERFLSISRKGESNSIQSIIKEYNSTLHEIKQLEPLPNPSDLSDEIYDLGWHTLTPDDCDKLAKSLISKYGTPKSDLQQLPEMMPEWFKKVVSVFYDRDSEITVEGTWKILYSKYGTPKRKWYEGLKEGDNIRGEKGSKLTFKDIDVRARITVKEGGWVYADDCTPYVEPNTREKLLATMTDEQKELLAKLEAER